MKKYREIGLILLILSIIILLNLILVYGERQVDGSAITSFSSAFWYMIVTLTTVGYGDLTPQSTIGKTIGYIYVFSSLGVLGYLFSAVSNKIYTIMEEKKLGFRGVDYENHILVIGWNDFSRMVAEEIALTEKRMAIITNQKDEIELIYNQFGKENIFVLFSDYQNFEGLTKVNANKASVVFISLEDDSESLMYVLDFKKSFPEPNIVVSLQKPRLKETFHAAGVTYALSKSEIASKLVASYIFEPDVANMNIELISSSRSDDDNDIQEYHVKDHNPYFGKNCLETFMSLKNDYNSVLLGIYKSRANKVITNPGDNVMVELNDYLIILSNGYNKKQIHHDFKVTEGRIIRRKD